MDANSLLQRLSMENIGRDDLEKTKITSTKKDKLLEALPRPPEPLNGTDSSTDHCGCVDSLMFVGIKHNQLMFDFGRKTALMTRCRGDLRRKRIH